MKNVKVAIIGAGVSGVTSALYLGQLGLDITLFEKEKHFISGPPFCHLHAGGNLYREISDEQCLTLLEQSIDFARFYPYVVDCRPTMIAVPINDNGTPHNLLSRLKILQKRYEELIEKDINNKILGQSSEYYKLYEKEEIEELKQREIVANPQSLDEWVIPVAKNLDLQSIRFPLVMVQEYGLNLFRLASGASIAINNMNNIDFKNETTVKNITQVSSKSFEISYDREARAYKEQYDYVINASGFRTGEIDDMLNVLDERMVEFKAAYITKCHEYKDIKFPEIIFHGERGTPNGMGQFTPYKDGYIQLHGMTNEITLYDDGLVKNPKESSQPQLGDKFLQKIENSWDREEVNKRTIKAINHISKYIPKFAKAGVGANPLFGAQQIPGNDPSLRVAEVSFAKENYARCEIVKVSSVMDMIDAIVKNMSDLKLIDAKFYKSRKLEHFKYFDENTLAKNAEDICKERGYPISLGNIVNSR